MAGTTCFGTEYRRAAASSRSSWHGVGLALVLIQAGALPRAAEAQEKMGPYDAYKITFRQTPYRQLPIAGGSPIVFLDFNSMEGGSADARMPFPVKFFDTSFWEVNIGTSGYVTFAQRGLALQRTSPSFAGQFDNHEIPTTWKSPNSLLALWWMELSCREQAATVHAQSFGVAPNRRYAVEWRRCYPFYAWGLDRGSVSMQIWFTEGSSTIETRYGPIVPGAVNSPHKASVGIMNGLDIGAAALPCSPNCGLGNWPKDGAIFYSQEPNLVAESIDAPKEGYPGLGISLGATATNSGTRTANNAALRFYLSPRADSLDGAIDLGPATESAAEPPIIAADGRATLAEGELAYFSSRATIPADIEPGDWFAIAVVNQSAVIPEPHRDDNISATPIRIHPPTADVILEGSFEVPATVRVNTRFDVRWKAINVGAASVANIPYTLRLTSDSVVSLTDRELASGTISLDPFGELVVATPTTIPAEVLPGTYRIGVILDPDSIVEEASKGNNAGVSETFVVTGSALRVITSSLPTAELGAPWCTRLDAVGGDGRYAWTVARGSKLPPGLALEERPGAASEEAHGFATLLCGRPVSTGTFEFTVEVESGGAASSRSFSLEVVFPGSKPVIATRELPVVPFDEPYAASLAASGGLAPYVWTVINGAIPSGLTLGADGRFGGIAEEDGSFPFLVRVSDRNGLTDDASLLLVVAAPPRLRCIVRDLPSQVIGAPYTATLRAAGGVRPYRWSSLQSRRLPTALGESSSPLVTEPPPGLALAEEGTVSGAPGQAGRYQWTVEVTDAANHRDLCVLLLDVPAENGLVVTTTTLMPAIAGEAYRTSLFASGGQGVLRWGLLQGSRLPKGMNLTERGVIEGVAQTPALGTTEEASFVVEVRDESNQRGLAPISLTILAERPPVVADGEVRESSSGGCQAGGTGGAGGVILLAFATLRSRIRRVG